MLSNFEIMNDDYMSRLPLGTPETLRHSIVNSVYDTDYYTLIAEVCLTTTNYEASFIDGRKLETLYEGYIEVDHYVYFVSVYVGRTVDNNVYDYTMLLLDASRGDKPIPCAFVELEIKLDVENRLAAIGTLRTPDKDADCGVYILPDPVYSYGKAPSFWGLISRATEIKDKGIEKFIDNV